VRYSSWRDEINEFRNCDWEDVSSTDHGGIFYQYNSANAVMIISFCSFLNIQGIAHHLGMSVMR
jgi:hypothetical protein